MVASMNGRFLDDEEKSLYGNPGEQQERTGGHGEYQERSEIVIVWLAAQGSAFFQVAPECYR
jgi:hypothetical protein